MITFLRLCAPNGSRYAPTGHGVAGVDEIREQKKTQSQKNARKWRRTPAVHCTLE
jgi:hypothetical protein